MNLNLGSWSFVETWPRIVTFGAKPPFRKGGGPTGAASEDSHQDAWPTTSATSGRCHANREERHQRYGGAQAVAEASLVGDLFRQR